LITVLDEKFKAVGLNPKEVSFAKTLRAGSAVKNAGAAKNASAVKKAGDAKTPDLTALRQSYVSVGKPIDAAVNQEIPEIFRMHELTASFNIEAEYQKLMNLIAAFEKDKYKIILNNINMGTKEGTAFNGSFSVSFISVPKLFEDGDKGYLDWLLKYNSNKYNPFAVSANLNPGETAPKPVVETPLPEPTPTPTPTPTPKPTAPTPAPPAPSKTSDFAITLRPISSDIPTVLVGKVNDKGAGAYVYADNTDFENVEIQILEKDGKLYYRYKTTSDSYPANYSDMTLFTPKSTGIIIEVLSTKRTGSEDKSGINLTVINKSNKKVTVSIKNDDTSRSRVKISSTSGSVTVRR
jgi:type IV pilus assembly protein PilO